MTLSLTSWNIQTGRGVDGVIDLQRIADIIRAMGDAEVICLQEVCVNSPGLDGGAGADQPALLAGLFPGYEPFFSAAVDHPAERGRSLFGNLILSRLPVLQCLRHALPQPADPGHKSMPRSALEVIVETGAAPLRVLTTHLEYYSVLQRRAQCGFLLELVATAAGRGEKAAPETGKLPYASVPETADSVMCGDFNLQPGSEEYRILQSKKGRQVLYDAWPLVSETGHAPTCGVHDRDQWPAGPHCRDYFFVTRSLKDRLRTVTVDTRTDASDHQPVRLEME